MIAAGTRLVVIGRAGVGVDNVDLEAATRAGITVVNAPTGNTIAAAELTLALLFGLARKTAAADASMRRGEWKRSQFTGIELRGKTLGIVGLGKIGQAIAVRARAMQMTVIGVGPVRDPRAGRQPGRRAGLLRRPRRRAPTSITVHVPKTKAHDRAHQRRRHRADEAGRAAAQRGPRRRHRRGGPRRRAAQRPGRRRRHRRATTAEPPTGLAAPRRAQHAAHAAPRRVHRGGPGRRGRGGGRADPRRARRTARRATRSTRRCSRPRPPRRSRRTCRSPRRWAGSSRSWSRTAPRTLTIEIAGEPAAYDALVARRGRPARACSRRRPRSASTWSTRRTLAKARGHHGGRAQDARRRRVRLAAHGHAPRRRAGPITVAGTVANGEPRLVRLDEHAMDLAPAEHMLITHHRDRPGTVGRVGRDARRRRTSTSAR